MVDGSSLQNSFLREIEKTAGEAEAPNASAFLIWFVKTRLDIEMEDAIDASSLDGPNDLGIDAVYVDEDARELHIFQAKYSNDAAKVVSREEAAAFIQSIRGLRAPDETRKIGNRDIRRRLKDIGAAFEKKFEVFAHFVVWGQFSASSRSEFKRDNGDGVQFELSDSVRILELFHEDRTKQEAAPPEVTIPVVRGETVARTEGKIPAAIVTIRGGDLAALEKSHGYALFQDNVRYYLTAKNRVNKRILKTLEEKTGREEFWYLNNGVSIVCRDFKFAEDGKVMILKDMQIVNGCQTTVTLSEAAREGRDLGGVEILARIIKTTDTGIKDKITESTNSQSTVRLRDFRSNDPIQRRLQKDIKDKGYYYIRKRGEEFEVPKKEGPRTVDMEIAAQLILAFKLRQGSEAKAKKGLLFSKEDGGLYSTIFSDDIDAEHILLAFELHKAVLKKKKEYRGKKNEYVVEYNDLKSKHGEQDSRVLKLNTLIEENEFILHADFHYLALISRFLKKHYGCELSAKDIEIIRTSSMRDDLFMRLYDIATNHIRALMKQKLRDVDFTHTKFFKNPSATEEIFVQSDEKIEEWVLMRPGKFFDGFPFPKLKKAA